jgi:ABC-type phosphate transport system substrate-binding protein
MKTKLIPLMKKRILILLIGSLIPALSQHASAQVLVIVNPGVSASNVSRTEIHDIFTGTSSTLKGGGQVIPVLLKPGPTHDRFLSLYIGKSDSGFRAGWRSILFSGQGVMPKTLESDAAVVQYVAHTPGAIGYIAPVTPHDGVKILTVR